MHLGTQEGMELRVLGGVMGVKVAQEGSQERVELFFEAWDLLVLAGHLRGRHQALRKERESPEVGESHDTWVGPGSDAEDMAAGLGRKEGVELGMVVEDHLLRAVPLACL
mmetsp:Transcript_55381/g.98601  ORF Transcript_55381/g.98601 Transcript_55381/m.98601 type:complete len:110 (-) Transcript_55381:437-766(-)